MSTGSVISLLLCDRNVRPTWSKILISSPTFFLDIRRIAPGFSFRPSSRFCALHHLGYGISHGGSSVTAIFDRFLMRSVESFDILAALSAISCPLFFFGLLCGIYLFILMEADDVFRLFFANCNQNNFRWLCWFFDEIGENNVQRSAWNHFNDTGWCDWYTTL